MNNECKCPQHGVVLNRLPIMYGLPIPGTNYDEVILGGCCITDNSPKYGFRCPVGGEIYFLENGQLVADVVDEQD